MWARGVRNKRRRCGIYGVCGGQLSENGKRGWEASSSECGVGQSRISALLNLDCDSHDAMMLANSL